MLRNLHIDDVLARRSWGAFAATSLANQSCTNSLDPPQPSHYTAPGGPVVCQYVPSAGSGVVKRTTNSPKLMPTENPRTDTVFGT